MTPRNLEWRETELAATESELAELRAQLPQLQAAVASASTAASELEEDLADHRREMQAQSRRYRDWRAATALSAREGSLDAALTAARSAKVRAAGQLQVARARVAVLELDLHQLEQYGQAAESEREAA
jgi:chromosome segregation ATPase